MNKRERLIIALKEERERFANRGQSTTEHDVAIAYLETGTTTASPERYELLDAAMNDFDCLCSDYGAV